MIPEVLKPPGEDAVRAFRRAARALAHPLPHALYREFWGIEDPDLLALELPLLDFSPFARSPVLSAGPGPAPEHSRPPGFAEQSSLQQSSPGEPAAAPPRPGNAAPSVREGTSLLDRRSPTSQFPTAGPRIAPSHELRTEPSLGEAGRSERLVQALPGLAEPVRAEPRAKSSRNMWTVPRTATNGPAPAVESPPVFSLRKPSHEDLVVREASSRPSAQATALEIAPSELEAPRIIPLDLRNAMPGPLQGPDLLGALADKVLRSPSGRSSSSRSPLGRAMGFRAGPSQQAAVAPALPEDATRPAEPGSLGAPRGLPAVPGLRTRPARALRSRRVISDEPPSPPKGTGSSTTQFEPGGAVDLGASLTPEGHLFPRGRGDGIFDLMPAATEIAGRDLPAFGDDLAGVVPEGLPDAQQLAALVNDALIEQARRHGLDLS